MKLGELLIQKKLISPVQLEQALSTQSYTNKRLGELLLERSFISPDDLSATLREQHWRKLGFWVIG